MVRREAIDRASFLALTFGMAGFGCPSPNTTGGASVIEIPPQPPQPLDGGKSIAPRPVASAKPPDDPVATDDFDADDNDMPSSASEGGRPVATAVGACGFVDAKSVKRPAPGCSDDKATVGTCGVMKSCSGFAFPKTKCEAYRKYFKPAVAQHALDCLAKLNDKQACDACNAYRCGDLAMKTSCADSSADATCVQVTTKCKSLSMDDCRLYMSGLNAAGRTKLAACMSASQGCGFGIFSCAEGLF